MKITVIKLLYRFPVKQLCHETVLTNINTLFIMICLSFVKIIFVGCFINNNNKKKIYKILELVPTYNCIHHIIIYQ